MPNLVFRMVGSTFSALASILPPLTALGVWGAGIPAFAAVACIISSVIVATGPVVALMVDQWQRARIVGQVLGKIDSAEDAAKLLQALAPPPVVNTSSRSPQRQ